MEKTPIIFASAPNRLTCREQTCCGTSTCPASANSYAASPPSGRVKRIIPPLLLPRACCAAYRVRELDGPAASSRTCRAVLPRIRSLISVGHAKHKGAPQRCVLPDVSDIGNTLSSCASVPSGPRQHVEAMPAAVPGKAATRAADRTYQFGSDNLAPRECITHQRFKSPDVFLGDWAL